jgi:hypothetical protein
MEFNGDRLQFLAGITAVTTYRKAVLTESTHINELDVTVSLEPANATEAEEVEELVGDVEVELSVEEPIEAVEVVSEPEPEEVEVEVEEEETVAEARLRRAIRREIHAVLAEVQIQNDERQLERARSTKSVSAALGFAGPGFNTRRRPNRSTSRGPGRIKGFGGIGFM